MHTALDCLPCFVRQTLDAVRCVTDDERLRERIMNDILGLLSATDLHQNPPAIVRAIQRRIRELTHNPDPYREIKLGFNQMVMEMLPDVRARMRTAPDPFALAVRMAVAGNVIDLGASGNMSLDDARQALAHVMDEPFYGDIPAFTDALEHAENILYLADNAGEIVFDRLLIEQFPERRTVVAVRGGPVINDVTMFDAEMIGLDRMVPVIDNGDDAPGTILADCSERFQRHFDQADLIVAKGQGNYETLSEADANIYFLFKIKCPLVAGQAGLPEGTHALLHLYEHMVRI